MATRLLEMHHVAEWFRLHDPPNRLGSYRTYVLFFGDPLLLLDED